MKRSTILTESKRVSHIVTISQRRNCHLCDAVLLFEIATNDLCLLILLQVIDLLLLFDSATILITSFLFILQFDLRF
jgi:hypothetical protein